MLDPEAAELAAASRPKNKLRLAAEKILASRKPAEKNVRLSRRKIMRLVDKNMHRQLKCVLNAEN